MSCSFLFCRNVKQFVERELKTDTFAMVIHGGEGGSREAELNSLQMGKQFYRIVKNRLELELNLVCLFNHFIEMSD